MYEFKNLLLKYPADWFIEPETLEKAKASLGHIIAFYEGLGTKAVSYTHLTLPTRS